MKKTPLDEARELILSITTPQDATEKIHAFSSLSPTELNKQLEDYYGTAVSLATNGDTKGISVMLRVLEHFHDQSHDRMLLHYIAQAEANKERNALQKGNAIEQKRPEIIRALQIISDAFKDADKINAQMGEK